MAFRLMVAVPTHSGALDSLAAESLLQFQRAAAERGYGFEARFHSGSVIATLRNLMAADFLQSDADALFMLDADQGVSNTTFLRMIDRAAPVVGCLYPKRRYNWGWARPASGSHAVERLIYQASEFVGALEPAAPGSTQATIADGFGRALYVGAGALLIRRQAFETLMGAFPALEGAGFDSREFPPPRFRHNWGFFNALPAPDGAFPLAEDFSFCTRWRDTGGEIWADVASNTGHAGRHVFTGNYLDYAQANSG